MRLTGTAAPTKVQSQGDPRFSLLEVLKCLGGIPDDSPTEVETIRRRLNDS